MSGKDIVRRYSTNKKDIKKRNWVVMPKSQDEDDFLVINNLLVNTCEFNKYKNSMEDMTLLYEKGQIARINRKMKDGIMEKTTVFGLPVKYLLNPKRTDGRCHGCVLAMATCVDNFTWAYANLTNRAIYYLNQTHDVLGDYILNHLYYESRNYNEVKPVFNHSYMIIEGKELIKQDIVDPKCTNFKVDENEKYVIDPRYDSIMKLDYYNKIMQPEYFTTYEKSEFENTKIWEIVKNQSKLESYEYDFEDFAEMYRQLIKPDNKGLENQICKMLHIDITCLQPYDHRIDVFYNRAYRIFEPYIKSINQESEVIQKL